MFVSCLLSSNSHFHDLVLLLQTTVSFLLGSLVGIVNSNKLLYFVILSLGFVVADFTILAPPSVITRVISSLM